MEKEKEKVMKTRILTQYSILLHKLREELSSAQHLELRHTGGKAACPPSKSTKYFITFLVQLLWLNTVVIISMNKKQNNFHISSILGAYSFPSWQLLSRYIWKTNNFYCKWENWKKASHPSTQPCVCRVRQPETSLLTHQNSHKRKNNHDWATRRTINISLEITNKNFPIYCTLSLKYKSLMHRVRLHVPTLHESQL